MNFVSSFGFKSKSGHCSYFHLSRWLAFRKAWTFTEVSYLFKKYAVKSPDIELGT